MLIRRQFLQKTGKIKGFARFVEAQKLLVKVRQKLPPVRPIENITVVEAAKALGQRDFVLSPTRLSGDNVDFCHLQWKLVDVNVCGSYLGIVEPIKWFPRVHSWCQIGT